MIDRIQLPKHRNPPKKSSQVIHFPYSTSHLGFDTFHVFLFCVYLSTILFFRSFLRAVFCLEEFTMVHYKSITRGWIAFANFNTTFDELFGF